MQANRVVEGTTPKGGHATKEDAPHEDLPQGQQQQGQAGHLQKAHHRRRPAFELAAEAPGDDDGGGNAGAGVAHGGSHVFARDLLGIVVAGQGAEKHDDDLLADEAEQEEARGEAQAKQVGAGGALSDENGHRDVVAAGGEGGGGVALVDLLAEATAEQHPHPELAGDQRQHEADAAEGKGPEGVLGEVLPGGALVGDGGPDPQHRHRLQRRVEAVGRVLVDEARAPRALEALHHPQQAGVDNTNGDGEPEGFEERSIHGGGKLL